MEIDLEHRVMSLGAGEFACFSPGPRPGGGRGGGLWRAELGRHWHRELQAQALAACPEARFEAAVEGGLPCHGWTVRLSGRVDQIIRRGEAEVWREVKTVTCALPADPAALRAAHPEHFLQLGAYQMLRRMARPDAALLDAELVFVDASAGTVQVVPLARADEEAAGVQLEAVAAFAESRRASRERLRRLVIRPAFSSPRAGQEDIQAELAAAWCGAAYASGPQVLLFEAPTGYGKTGVILEHALGELRAGRFSRLIWLTGKSTGQIQVMNTLAAMTPAAGGDGGMQVAAWQVRNKPEHCVNSIFHCLRDACPFIDGFEERWAAAGFGGIHARPGSPRDLESLRAAGRAAMVCPYEIMRAALAGQDVWIGDYNYLFSPSAAGLFLEQPGFQARDTLLVIDEAHNLPQRAADALSHRIDAGLHGALAAALSEQRAPSRLVWLWNEWAHFLETLRPCPALDAAAEADFTDQAARLAEAVAAHAVDERALGPHLAAAWRQPAELAAGLAMEGLGRLFWVPQPGELLVTCLDAAAETGRVLGGFGRVVLMSATLQPFAAFAEACGLEAPVAAEPPRSPAGREPAPAGETPAIAKIGPAPRGRKRLMKQVTTAAALLAVAEERNRGRPRSLVASAPWRAGACRTGVDLRVDTSYRLRDGFAPLTAATIEQVQAAAGGCIAAFFPSYSYAGRIIDTLASDGSPLRVALQPRGGGYEVQAAFIEESLPAADVLFLILGGGYAEGVDLLGGRITHAVVVGPALPEVNAVQKARMAQTSGHGRDAAFRSTYLIPGMRKVNQALGRLVRAPGQHATVLLHCRRFADPAYAGLLAGEYRGGELISCHEDLDRWLRNAPAP